MQEVNQEIIGWVDEAQAEERQERIDFVRQEIGKVLMARLQDIKKEEPIIVDSLNRLGIFIDEEEPRPEIFLSYDSYMETGTELMDNKGLWSRLWLALWRRHQAYRMEYGLLENDDSLTHSERLHRTVRFQTGPNWGKLFNADGDLSVTRLDPLVRNHNIRDLHRIGKGSLEAAKLLVEHFTTEESTK